jgi:hypothetical protein
MAAAEQKLIAMQSAAVQRTTTPLGMPSFGPAVGRSSSTDDLPNHRVNPLDTE